MHEAIVPRDLWEKVQTPLQSGNQGERNGVRINAPSLLVGLVQDASGRRQSLFWVLMVESSEVKIEHSAQELLVFKPVGFESKFDLRAHGAMCRQEVILRPGVDYQFCLCHSARIARYITQRLSKTEQQRGASGIGLDVPNNHKVQRGDSLSAPDASGLYRPLPLQDNSMNSDA